jgi:hypothetical protein
MVKHVAMWKLRDQAHGNMKLTNAKLIKEKLESLNGKIPGMLKLEVGIDFSATKSSADIVLYSEFESKDVYRDHPGHKSVMPFILEAIRERRVVDYET